MKPEVSQFQQKAILSSPNIIAFRRSFSRFSTRIERKKLDEGFKDRCRHLRWRVMKARLPQRKGAEAETEQVEKTGKIGKTAPAPALKRETSADAINAITVKVAIAILKSLINHAAKFTPRGVLRVKNQHL